MLVTLLLGSTACSSGNAKESTDPEKTADSTRETCEVLLGAAGVKWVKRSSVRETGLAETSDLKSAKDQYYEDARAWDSQSNKVPVFTGSEVCRVVVKEQKPHKNYLSFRYGASIFPFDYPFGKKTGIYDAKSVISVNSDVKFVIWKDRGSPDRYSVYVKCGVPGAPAGQETGVPIEGSMTDTLTGETTAENHLKYLLHSARVVAQTFDCQNKPTVPEELPAGI
ncbi:hypothetical protein ACFV7R_10935 [Streptomyces sp. NPDC059866]|uniref:hypothetical protein n=1 Tax=Streptomyces sp. NPDC059866 TaxID=3346978 RepID=UPI003669DC29